MRVALIRGSLLRPWELPNYDIDGLQVEAFASRAVAAGFSGGRLPVHGLRSSGDLVRRIGARPAAAIDLLAGSVERLAGLERALRGFDVAHALELANPLTAQALRARDAGACRAVVATVMENIPYRRPPNRWVAERIRRVAAGVDMFLAVTEYARMHLRTAGVDDERITVLPLGIDMERFAPGAGDGGRDGRLRVLTVARLETGKGVEDLVIAAGILRRRGVAVDVTLAGEGPLRERLREIAANEGIADRVRFAGSTPWERLERLYREHDAFVLASAPTTNWREQFGFAIVEAMACGLPVVAGGSGSLPQVVPDADCLVRPHDPLHLAERLAVLASDPARRRAEGERSRRWALERYDVRRVREELREIYAAVLEARTA